MKNKGKFAVVLNKCKFAVVLKGALSASGFDEIEAMFVFKKDAVAFIKQQAFSMTYYKIVRITPDV